MKLFPLGGSLTKYAGWSVLCLLLIGALSALVAAFEMSRAERILADSVRALNNNRPTESLRALNELGESRSFRFVLKMGLMNDGELMRQKCAALVLDREHEKAIAECTKALSSPNSQTAKEEIAFNRASSMIELTLTGNLTGGGKRAVQELTKLLRTSQHSKAALLIEKLSIAQAGQKKGSPMPGDTEDGNPIPSDMFDDGTPALGGGAGRQGY